MHVECRERLFYKIAHFLFVILTIEDFPFPAAFGDDALLALDLLPGGFVDFFFLLKPFHEDIDDGKTDRVPVLDEFHFIEGGEFLGNLVGKEIDLFSG